MQRNIRFLKENHFDLVIIGGGITGACLAHEATLGGLKTALVEQKDFGGFTSASSSKLLHGGIRYMPKLQMHKVRESARERAVFQHIAPHLTRTIPFIIPTFSNSFMQGRLAMTAGMGLYELINCGLNRNIADPVKRIPPARRLRLRRLARAFPELRALPGLDGAWLLPEVHMHNSERTTLAFIRTASRQGACVANYVAATGLLRKEGRVAGITVRDRLSGEQFALHAHITANAAGPLIPRLYQKHRDLGLKKPTTGYSKGVHLVTRQLNPDFALGLNSSKQTEGYVNRGGRHIFFIPWRGCSLIGTTNVPFQGDPGQVAVTRRDIVDFVHDINALLPGARLKTEDVYYAFAGLYPLIAGEIKPGTYQGTGEYQVIDHGTEDGVAGIVTVLGAKYTTARIVAEKAGRLIARKLGFPLGPRRGRACRLLGGDIGDWHAFREGMVATHGRELDPKTIHHLIQRYGSQFERVFERIQATPDGCRPLSPVRNTLTGEIHHFVEQEMARTLEDVIFRRSGLGTIGHPGGKVLRRVGELMGSALGWSPDQLDDQIRRVEQHYVYL